MARLPLALTRAATLAAAGLLVLTTAGCASGPEDPWGDVAWEDPGWMAQARQEVEEFQNAMMSCLAERGVRGIVTFGAVVGVGGPFDPADLPPGTEVQMATAQQDCLEIVPQPSVWTTPADAAAYQRTLEVRECLIAHGFEIPEPPAMEVWVEMEIPWNPWATVFSLPQDAIPDDDALRELISVCPQSGHGLHVAIPEDAWD